MKVIAIEESKDVDTIKIETLFVLKTMLLNQSDKGSIEINFSTLMLKNLGTKSIEYPRVKNK